jgi:hypothetical protein
VSTLGVRIRHNPQVVLTVAVVGGGAAGGGFVLGATTAGELSDAFLLAASGALAVAAVAALVGGIRWLFNLDRKMTSLVATVETGFAEASDALADVASRLSTVEAEFIGTEQTGTQREAIERIDRRSRKIAEHAGAVDYDDEDAT